MDLILLSTRWVVYGASRASADYGPLSRGVVGIFNASRTSNDSRASFASYAASYPASYSSHASIDARVSEASSVGIASGVSRTTEDSWI